MTISQKIPDDCVQKVVNFITYLRKKISTNSFEHSQIIAMDETPIWVEPVATSTIDTVGVKQVPIKSTRHEKVRITTVLSAKAEGSKLKLYIVIPWKCSIKELEKMRGTVFIYRSKI